MQNGIAFIFTLLTIFVFLSIFFTYLIEIFVSPTSETPKKVRKEIIDIMNVLSSETVADLGSGSGAFLIELLVYSNAKGVGYDISPIMVIIARFKALWTRFMRKEKVSAKFDVADFFSQDYRDVDVIYLHQPPLVMKHFEKKAKKMVAAGQRVFTYETAFPELAPHKTHELNNGKKLFEY